MASGISIHAVDVAEGVPAMGLRVEIFRQQPSPSVCIAAGALGPQGTLEHPITRGEAVTLGSYEAHFHFGDWWRSRSGTSQRYFQELGVFRFEITDLAQHYHLPIKFTQWGFALFRGA